MKSVKEMLLRHRQIVARGFHTVDHVLRRHDFTASEDADSKQSPDQPTRIDTVPTERRPLGIPLIRVVTIVFICGPLYGAAMGSYAFLIGRRTFWEQAPQLVYSGVKVPLLIAITVLVSLPSFFVINTLLGLRDDFQESLRAIVSAQAGLTIVLLSLFPLTLFSYVSFSASASSYSLAVLFNAAMFGLASVSGQILLRGYYQPLISRNSRHRILVRTWIFVYAFVGIQAAYILRPFIGSPESPVSFFRKESFENAYVKVFQLVWNVVRNLAGG